MKYIITVLMILPTLYSSSNTYKYAPFTLSSSSGSISAEATNALESADCKNGSIILNISNTNGPFYVEWSNGENTVDLTDLSPGEYCVTVTDDICGVATGCWEVKCCPFLFEPDQININVTHPACESVDGIVELSLSNIDDDNFPMTTILENKTDYTIYDLEVVSSTTTIEGLSVGDYIAHLNYGEGCSGSFEFDISIKAIEVEFEQTASCDQDGTITVLASNGALPYSYSWSDDSSVDSDFRSGLDAGFYTVTITDTNLCSASATVYVKDSDPIDIASLNVFIGPTECDDNTGLIDISNDPIGGNPPFTYAWDNGGNGKFLTNLEGGKHTVTITDSEGCEVSTIYFVPTEGLPEIINEQIEKTCQNENFGLIGVLAQTSNGNTPNFLWSTGSNSTIIDNLESGTYSLTLTDPSTNCELIKEYEIEEFNTSPIIIDGTNVDDCGGSEVKEGEINISIDGGVPPYTYEWNNGSTNKNISNLSKGTYFLNVTDYCGQSSTYSAYVDEVNINPKVSWELNFGIITITSDPIGGEAPYTFLWSNGESQQSIEVGNQDIYAVTVTDNFGCTATQEVDISFDCTNLELEADINPDAYICSLPIVIDFDPINGNQSIQGNAPFTVKVQKTEGQELVTKDFSFVPSIYQLNNYKFTMSSGGTFLITVTDNCGLKYVAVVNSCYECYYDFYNEGENVYVDLFEGLLTLEQVCPCDEDCDWGFTHDKIKLYVDEAGILDSALPYNLFNFTITWPNESTTTISKSAVGTDPTVYSVNVNGPTEYVLSDDDFTNGIVVGVSYNAVEGGSMQEQCQMDVPFEFNQKGRNGQFEMWQSQNNPFSGNYELPYYESTFICNTKCEIPIENGNLYGNQPTDVWDNVLLECDEDDPDSERNYFQFFPLDWSNPCFGGGYLRTHVELNGEIYLTTKYIGPGIALDQAISTIHILLDDQGTQCSTNALHRGYCLFEGLDIYGIETNEHLIAAYCSEEIFVPITDTDGDGIPDDDDPCPLDPDLFCDEDDDEAGSGGGGGNTDSEGCKTVYLPDECKIALICPDQEPEYFEGSIVYETVSGISPCIYCGNAEFCKVINPITGEEISKLVGPVANGVSVETDPNGCSDPGLCKVTFNCESNGEYIHHVCTPGCSTSTSTLKLCTDQQVYDILNSLNDSGSPDTTYLNMSYEEVKDIISKQKEIGRNDIFSKSKDLETTPNPSKSDFLVRFSSDNAILTTIEIRNVSYELVYTQKVGVEKGTNMLTIENSLPSGLYIISIRLHNKIISTNHVIQK